eukprot:TRINITY_DN680_c0_g1_i1.p1 TRINITY_DN680_c0_g1~~TRINITY_DN680_c0_g1_i1.p1  ORF type:complete len:374 (-),score=37.38 TRINITY_DN680_c0_g1_i1:1601-2722(-)
MDNINPSKLKRWSGEVKLKDAFNTCFSLHEKFFSSCPVSQDMGDNPSFDFRVLQYTIGSHLDDRPDCKLVAIQNDDHSKGILMRIRAIKQLKEGVPLIEVIYSQNSKADLSENVKQQICLAHHNVNSSVSIILTSKQQESVVEYLKKNTQRMDKEYVQNLRKTWLKGMPMFDPSFLSIVDAPDENHVPSKPVKLCASCKQPASKTCSRCLSAHYCSKECQKTHWKTHKEVCGKATQKTENSVVLPIMQDDFSGLLTGELVSCTINRYKGTLPPQRLDKVPKNYAGDEKFVVKLQTPMPTGFPQHDVMAGAMLIYDELQTFRRLIPQKEECFSSLSKLVRENGFMGLKMYMYAKREGQNLRIFLDDFPSQNQPW